MIYKLLIITYEDSIRKYILIVTCLATISCGQKSDVIGVKTGDEYYALDHAAKDAVVTDDKGSKLICRKVKVTGSHLKIKKCTTMAQKAMDRKNALELLDNNTLQNNRNRTSKF